MDPHAYCIVRIDERSLTAEDRRQAIVDAAMRPGTRSWAQYISNEEWAQHDKEVAEIERQAEIKRAEGVIFGGEPPGIAERRLELVRRGTFRAYAQQKYGRLWYGDGAPGWLS